MYNYKNLAIWFFLILVLASATFATWLYSQIDSALPKLDGKQTLYGLSAKTIVERDEKGIPTIKANNREDVAIATGFLHAQERFFQMDLLRRNSAGELSSLFGELALNYDKSIRRHRFRDRARDIVKNLPSPDLQLLKAYTRGVNQGLDYLKASPFEYLLLQQPPVKWREEDTVLAVFSMYIDLQYAEGERETTLALLHQHLNQETYNFITPKGSNWDAAIDNSTFKPSPMPASWQTLSELAATSFNAINIASSVTSPLKNQLDDKYDSDIFLGSNNWAVSGNVSATESAIVANDMHLGIRVPNTWYRASFEYPQSDNSMVKVTGLTLPGTPNIVVGSNGKIAWGYTNSYGDWSDVIELELNEDNTQYLTPNGYKKFKQSKQLIAVKDQPAQELIVKETIWGPVISDKNGKPTLAYRWVAHDRQAVNLHHAKLELASTIDDAFLIAAHSGIPAQNLMVGDSLGQIGWTVMGPIPRKKGQVGELPTTWSTGENSWQGYLTADEYPQVKNPKNNRLWTANSRVIGGKMYQKMGNGGYALGARSSQIKQGLLAVNNFEEQDLLNIALDENAVFLKRWQSFLLEHVLTEQAITRHGDWQAVKLLVEQTPLAATTGSVAYRIVRNFRINVRDRVFASLNKIMKQKSPHYSFRTIRHQVETPLWQLITQQPDNFTWLEGESWLNVFEQSLTETIADMTENQSLADATWGQQNTAAIQHPLSKAVPIIGRWLDMPATPLAGDDYMPRVQRPSSGASERMVVSPGHEEQGILHMPTSQAGHPWSPYYGLGHQDWVHGNPSSFLPGKTKYTLTLLSY